MSQSWNGTGSRNPYLRLCGICCEYLVKITARYRKCTLWWDTYIYVQWLNLTELQISQAAVDQVPQFDKSINVCEPNLDYQIISRNPS